MRSESMRHPYSGFLCCRRPSLAICQQSTLEIIACGQTGEVKRSAGGLPVEGQLGASRGTSHITGTHRQRGISYQIEHDNFCWCADLEHANAKCKSDDASCDRLSFWLLACRTSTIWCLSLASLLDHGILFSYRRHRKGCSWSAWYGTRHRR